LEWKTSSTSTIGLHIRNAKSCSHKSKLAMENGRVRLFINRWQCCPSICETQSVT
jgi:hypothetical protein